MAKKEYFDGKMAWFFKLVGCIPVDRSIKDHNATDKGFESILKMMELLDYSPKELGNKTKNVFLLPFKFGTVSMAKKRLMLLSFPLVLTGDYKFRSKNLTIRYGTPFKVGEMDLDEANKKLYEEVERLMRENLEGEEK